ncbi:MAG TPA: PKD domain-containing protein, partial [Cyclobacteriaceae bacterium]|nr:PKD domain-containing protein [Cyclobacteriaceae bacterium]
MACVKRVNENGGKKLHKQGLLLLILLLPFSVLAQDLSKHNWYFGNSANGIRFNRGTNVAQPVTNQATPFGQGGAAVATDPATANLLFYTDGIRVYDATHTIMPNGTGLNALANTNQPVAICPMPGQTNRWYIFTNTASFTTGGSISRSAVDMNQPGNAVFPAPFLGVVEAAKNVAVPLLTNRSEAMIIVPHENNIDFWLITHQNGGVTFNATLIDAAATFNTVISTPDPSGTNIFPHSAANFAYHEATGKLAVSPQSRDINAYILNFDNATGAISFDRTIFNSSVSTPASNNQSIYDIEWDNQGRYLYLSVHGDASVPANVFQYDYLNPGITLAPIITPAIFRSYGLQVAPDSAIYHLYQSISGGPFLAGRLTNTDTIASEVINTQALFGGSNFNGTQFPSFKPRDSVELQVSFIAQGTCQNSPTSFFPTVLPNADSLNWDFGDGSGSNNWSPVYTYAAAGTFNVTLTAFYRGQTESTTQPVTINPFALTLQLVQDTTACRDEFPPPRGTATAATQFRVTVQVQGGTPVSTIWSNGDIGPTLTPDSAGYYYVVVTDATGCSAYAGVNVKEYGLQDQRSNVWHFGNTAGIDFNETPPVALDNSAMDAPEGCAIVCDRNGDVIFYTDGDKVFDKTDTEIDSGIGGDPAASQSAIIVPVPGDETLYYIFTTQAVNGTGLFEVRYSLFDLKLGLNGGLQQKNVLLFSRSTERITANERWVIVHEYGNNVFRSYPISADGIGQPVYSEIGSDHSFQSAVNAEGYMNLGSGNQIAVTLSTPGISNFVELFVLDDSTGVLSNFRQIDLNEPNGQVYGVEFSPGGNKIFATVKGSPTPSAIFEYYLDSLSRPVFKQRIDQNLELGAIQIGPDGQIYVAINGSNTLGIIQAVEDTTQFSTFNPSGFALLGGTNSRLGLPNFIDQNSNAFGGPGFTVAGACLGDTTIFEGVATDAIDNFLWSFGDGGTSTEDSTSHVYAAAGVYTVSMRLTNRCGLDTTIVRQVEIFAPPAPPSIPGAIALCTGAVTLDANIPNTPGIRHTWSNGATTQTVTLNNPASISVTNTSVNGCTSTAQTIVVDNRPPVDLGPDLTICEDDNSITILNAQNPGATYQWTINGVNASTIQTQGVDVTTPGIFTYEVTVTDPFTTCFTVEDKVITINVSPAVTLSQTDPTSCGTPDGTITLQLNPSVPPAGPYSYSLTGPNSFLQQDADLNAPSTIPFTGLEAGTYSAFVRDQISNCPSSPSIFLADVTLTITPTVTDPCIVAYSV